MLDLCNIGGRDVLRKAHRAKLIEYDAKGKTVTLSPEGVKKVEHEILR